MPREETYEDVAVQVVQESERAYAVRLSDERKIWIPKSCIDLDQSGVVAVGTFCTLAISTWFCEKEALI